MSVPSPASRPGVYTLSGPLRAQEETPLLLDSPHSGRSFPTDFNFICSESALRASEDTGVDRLIAQAPAAGATILCADFTRTYLDLNRALSDLDPALCATPVDWPLHPTKRTQFGLGLIHTRAGGQEIYAAPLPADAIARRVRDYYTPYHACLTRTMTGLRDRFGLALHLNIHAMPSMTIEGKLLPDIVIGDLDGTSAHRVWRDTVRDLFKAAGLVVTVNTPYKGVEIIKRTGKPRHGQQALQIEINKALYLDEQALLPNAQHAECVAVMQSIWSTLGDILRDVSHQDGTRDAAE